MVLRGVVFRCNYLHIQITSMMIIIVGASLSEQHTDLDTAGFVTRTHK